jgi:voltage-gated sodium channel
MAAPGSPEEATFQRFDLVLTIIFTAELLVNLTANSDRCFQPFYSKPNNWLDAFIVLISLANVLLASLGTSFPNAKLLRLLRIVRIVRIFKSLKDLKKILAACSCAVLPVCNAFLILLIIAAVYAILGTNFFSETSPEFFGNFSTSLFTMFQVPKP